MSPWIVVESDDPEYAEVKVLRNIIDRLESSLARPPRPEVAAPMVMGGSPRATVDLSAMLPDDEYKDRLDKQRGRMKEAQCRLFQKKKRLVVVFEGRDASGKGGNINRLAQVLNTPDLPGDTHGSAGRHGARAPLSLAVPTEPAPPGHIRIFDRSWYGRVLVERVESLVPEATWRRATARSTSSSDGWSITTPSWSSCGWRWTRRPS
jgi:polyphosphate kinase 2 (PPK2 family)